MQARQPGFFTKRSWTYAGISHPPGIVLARRQKGGVKAGEKILLVGDEHAAGIGQFLGVLALEARVNLRFEWEKALTLERWLSSRHDRRDDSHAYDVVLLLMSAKCSDPNNVESLVKKMRQDSLASKARYILPFSDARIFGVELERLGVDLFRTDKIVMHLSPTGGPSVRGYAGWAGSVWNWLT